MDLERPQNRLGYTHVEFYITGFVQTLLDFFALLHCTVEINN